LADPHVIEYYASSKSGTQISIVGLLYGGGITQLIAQFKALIVIVAFNAIMTFLVLKIIGPVVPLRASEGEVAAGDLEIHGQEAIPQERIPATIGTIPAVTT
jgi:Amt family ammonium transporter